MKKTIIILLSLVLLWGVFILSKRGKTSDLFNDIDLPVYPQGYLVIEGFEEAISSRYLVYRVKIAFPASGTRKFYNENFKKIKFSPFSEDGYGLRRWEDFNYKSGEWEKTEKVPAKYIATWVDKAKEKRITLVLEYRYEGGDDTEWKNILLVDCKVSPFFDFREIKKAFKNK